VLEPRLADAKILAELRGLDRDLVSRAFGLIAGTATAGRILLDLAQLERLLEHAVQDTHITAENAVRDHEMILEA
jgi:hypothetical protein